MKSTQLYDADQAKVEGVVFGQPLADLDPVTREPRLLFKLETSFRRRIGGTKEKPTRKARLDVVIYGKRPEGETYPWLTDGARLVLNGWLETTKAHPAFPGQDWTMVLAAEWDGVRVGAEALRRSRPLARERAAA